MEYTWQYQTAFKIFVVGF